MKYQERPFRFSRRWQQVKEVMWTDFNKEWAKSFCNKFYEKTGVIVVQDRADNIKLVATGNLCRQMKATMRTAKSINFIHFEYYDWLELKHLLSDVLAVRHYNAADAMEKVKEALRTEIMVDERASNKEFEFENKAFPADDIDELFEDWNMHQVAYHG